VFVNRAEFLYFFRVYVFIRFLLALGALGSGGFFELKPGFVPSVALAAAHLTGILQAGLPIQLPELEGVLERIATRWSHGSSEVDEGSGLIVHLGSFSYRGGYPSDDGGHGGGFVFDCRAIPNPGREPEYADRTGLDPDVVEYIERSAEAAAFWKNVQELVDAQVREYLRRGFTSLSVQFGCTGGQHRSVYFAERVARHLAGTYPDVRVRLVHQESGAWPTRSPSGPA
jgi:hypothetical protein